MEGLHMRRLAPHLLWEKEADQQPRSDTALRPLGPEEAEVSREWGGWALLFDSHLLSLYPWASYFFGPSFLTHKRGIPFCEATYINVFYK